jgi:Putative adhesin
MSQVTHAETAPLPGGPEPGAPADRGDRRLLTGVRVATALVVLAALTFGTLLVVSSFFKRQHTETRAFTGTVRAVQVTSDIGDVRVRVVQPGEPVRATARITKAFEDPRWVAELRGGTLGVTGVCGDDGFVFDCAVDLTIAVPAGIPVQIRSATGDVTVVGAFSGVDATTNTGDVLAQGVAGPVRIETNTGDVRALSTTGRVVDADTDTGDVRLTFDAPPDTVAARTNTGDVRVVVPDDGTVYEVDADTSTGDTGVDIQDVPDAGRTITAQTDTGDVRVTYP